MADLHALLDVVRTADSESLPQIVGTLAHAHAIALSRLNVRTPDPIREPDPLLTMPETAKRLGITEHQAREMGRRGELPIVTVGERFVRVRAAALEG